MLLGKCPKGDDPLTTFSSYRTIKITTGAKVGTYGGTFKFSYNGEYFTIPADSTTWTKAECEASFQGLSNIGEVMCEAPVEGAYLAYTKYVSHTIQFRGFPTIPRENNVFSNDGNPLLADFACSTVDITGVTGPICEIVDVANTNLPGLYVCGVVL